MDRSRFTLAPTWTPDGSRGIQVPGGGPDGVTTGGELHLAEG